jgi:hypothetical protein
MQTKLILFAEKRQLMFQTLVLAYWSPIDNLYSDFVKKLDDLFCALHGYTAHIKKNDSQFGNIGRIFWRTIPPCQYLKEKTAF